MGVLNKEQVIIRCENAQTPMIVPFDRQKAKYASYDLTVGSEYRISSDPFDQKIPAKGTILIPSYQVCYVLTEEKLNLPNNVCASLFSRMKGSNQGIIMHPQAPIDPGYSGGLFILLHNLSDRDVILNRGEHLASIVFYDVNDTFDPEEKAKGYGSNEKEDTYQHKYHLEDLIGNYTYKSALQELDEKWSHWREELLNKYLPMILTIITIVIAILAIYVTIKSFTSNGSTEGSSTLNTNYFFP